ncbi:MAG: polynucleotide adenylyltransferase PcnB [Lysobacterales bacterium CG02_land_8_20_14_3_00_62_12]|nr:MAG: polynucleotide adenylyltransferase PcnB [Xanthomonadales bacterium CG02_land_8_20_14_3_00_62_12]
MLKKLFDRAFGRKPATSPANAPGTQASAKVDAVAINLQVIARDGHCISRKHISPNALRVLYKLRDAGFTAYLVGGAVRDLLLQGLPKDFDVATNAHPEQVKHLFRNCRLIGRRFRLAHVHYGAEIIEVATFRGIEDDGSGARELVDGRIVRDNVYGTIEEDAVRRDFTVNALYYAIDDYSVRDYVGGFQDVRDRVLRLIGEPTRRLREDPVRMLRTARFAAKLGFSIDPAIVSAISQLKDLLNAAPAARLFDECLKMFMAGYALASFRQLWQLRLFEVLFPETALALRADPADLVLLETALTSTDQRIADDKPVTPAFLFAALLWPAVKVMAARNQQRGAEDPWDDAIHSVVSEQTSRIALPKRFSLPMQEIWSLQSRFETRQKKRVGRLLAHPRFRAAFDFLALRAHADPTLQPTLAFWLSLASGEAAASASTLGDLPTAADGEALSPPKKRRRRRRKPRLDANQTAGAGDHDAG